MKKFIKILSLVVIGALVLNSCKKGENDPSLSLKSRKARLAGEYELTNYEGTIRYTADNYTETYSYSNGILTVVVNDDGDVYTGSELFTYKAEFDKKGNYSMVTAYTAGSESEKGYWNFLGKNEEMEQKNKQSISLQATESQSSGSGNVFSSITKGDNSVTIFEIDQLKSKELVLMQNEANTTEGYSNTIKLTLKKK